jgi:uncharacterized protein (TIGR00730 family)
VSLRSVAVFCGSRSGSHPEYAAAAATTGRVLAARGTTLVYGGGRVGLMGVVADAALAAGGRVVGVIPQALHERELTHTGVSELHVVGSMHERKARMADLADAFVALPGGAGTLEEVAEQWTWAQLTLHAKRSGFLDVRGFWGPVRAMLERMVADGFVRPEQQDILRFDDDVERLLDSLDEPLGWTDKWGGALPVPPP